MFQSTINNQPAPAIEGDFCSANPRSTLLTGPGGLVAGPLGVTIGRFAWADAEDIVRNIGGGGIGRIGFVHRANLSIIPNWLGKTSMIVPAGYEIALHSSGDFWARFAAGATVGQKVWANYADGSAVSAVTGVAPNSASATGTIAAVSSSFNGSIAPYALNNTDEPGGIMTVTSAPSNPIVAGGAVGGSGVISGQTVISQISGTPGGIGVYEVSIAQTLAVQALTEAYGTFTAASGLSGTFGVGDTLTGTNVVANSQITQQGTGVGGLGTYFVNNTQTVASTTITAATAVETQWFVDSYAAAGDLAKISRAG